MSLITICRELKFSLIVSVSMLSTYSNTDNYILTLFDHKLLLPEAHTAGVQWTPLPSQDTEHCPQAPGPQASDLVTGKRAGAAPGLSSTLTA